MQVVLRKTIRFFHNPDTTFRNTAALEKQFFDICGNSALIRESCASNQK